MARGNDLQVVTQVGPDQAGLVTLTMRNLSLGPPVHLRREGVRDTARKRVIDTVSDAQPPDELNLPRRAVQERPGQEEEQQIMLRGLRLEKRGEKRDKRERGLLVVVKPKLHRHVRSRLRLSCKEKDPPIVQGLAHRKLRLLCPGKLANVSEVAWRRTARVLTRVIVSQTPFRSAVGMAAKTRPLRLLELRHKDTCQKPSSVCTCASFNGWHSERVCGQQWRGARRD